MKDGYTYEHLVARLKKEEPWKPVPFVNPKMYVKKVEKVDNVIRK